MPIDELQLPDDTDMEAFVSLVADQVRIDAEAPQPIDERFADTFDGRLARAGLTARITGDEGGAELRLLAADPTPTRRGVTAAPRWHDVPVTVPDGRRVRLDDIPPGSVRDRLARVIDNRAILPLVHLRGRRQLVRVVDRYDTSVARLTLDERVVVRADDADLPLGRRVRLEPMRGYEGPRRKITSLLRHDLALPPVTGSLLHEARCAVGLDPTLFQAGIDVGLRGEERADRALSSLLGRLAEVVAAQVPGILADHDPEFVHDLDVAVRRARTLVRWFDGVIHPGDGSRLADELRWIQEVTAAVRDVDGHLLAVEVHRGTTPDIAQDLVLVAERLTEQRTAALEPMFEALRSPRFAAAIDAWRAAAHRAGTEDIDPAVAPDAAGTIHAVAGRRIREVFGELSEIGTHTQRTAPPGELEVLRDRGRELRQLLEMFGHLYDPEVVVAMMRSLRSFLDLLGRLLDTAVHSSALTSIGTTLPFDEPSQRAVMAIGRVTEGLGTVQTAARVDLRGRVARLASPARAEQVDAEFR